MRFNRKLMIIVLCALSIALVSVAMVTAQEEKEKETVTITGTVLQTDAGLIMMSDAENYILTGQDLSSMVDKEIEVTGTVTEGEQGSTITVTSFREIEK